MDEDDAVQGEDRRSVVTVEGIKGNAKGLRLGGVGRDRKGVRRDIVEAEVEKVWGVDDDVDTEEVE